MHDMADHAMSGPMDEAMMLHMEMTPSRAGTAADSARNVFEGTNPGTLWGDGHAHR